MEISTFLMLYPVVFLAGAVITQLLGNAGRPLHEGILAWLFMPLAVVTCLSALSDGLQGLKSYWHEFLETLFNYHFKPPGTVKDAHRIKGETT